MFIEFGDGGGFNVLYRFCQLAYHNFAGLITVVRIPVGESQNIPTLIIMYYCMLICAELAFRRTKGVNKHSMKYPHTGLEKQYPRKIKH